VRRCGLENEVQAGNRPCALVLGDLDRVDASYESIAATFTMHKWGIADG